MSKRKLLAVVGFHLCCSIIKKALANIGNLCEAHGKETTPDGHEFEFFVHAEKSKRQTQSGQLVWYDVFTLPEKEVVIVS